MNIDWEEVRNIVGWIVMGLAAVLIAWAPVKCSMDTNEKIAQAVARGANPMDAKCAFANGNTGADCTVRAAISGKEQK